MSVKTTKSGFIQHIVFLVNVVVYSNYCLYQLRMNGITDIKRVMNVYDVRMPAVVRMRVKSMV